MTQNLKLGLCPSCGDTKHVDSLDWTQYPCSKPSICNWWSCDDCKIKWNADHGVYDMKNDKWLHIIINHIRSADLVSREYRKPDPTQWWRN